MVPGGEELRTWLSGPDFGQRQKAELGRRGESGAPWVTILELSCCVKPHPGMPKLCWWDFRQSERAYPSALRPADSICAQKKRF
jgi:hypothetical protein